MRLECRMGFHTLSPPKCGIRMTMGMASGIGLSGVATTPRATLTTTSVPVSSSSSTNQKFFTAGEWIHRAFRNTLTITEWFGSVASAESSSFHHARMCGDR